ncbi:MAG TPA: amidohydrolase family protein [Microvirga sp.]|jgi:5-methylthioadenosine/S-adenosylhomocysteine deaminase|nr:amidohydrolase family protein [Microvirga sp.]
MALVLHNAAVLTVDRENRVLAGRDIRIEDGAIAAIGPAGTLARAGDETLDCTRALVMPGFVNVHTHAATALFRGLSDDLPRAFWANAYRVPGQERFTPEDYARSLRGACAEYLLNGVTCIADRLAGMETWAPIIEESGLRAVVGETITDARGSEGWEASERVLARYGTDPSRRVFAGLAPHALDSCSDALLARCAARARDLGGRVFIHVAQNELEVERVRERGHAGALACLRAAGLTGPDVVAAHAIYLSDAEMEGWIEDGTAIAHCPASNLKIEARTLPIHRFVGRVPVGLGTDWTATNNSNDMIVEARLAALVGKMLADDPTVLPVGQMIRMLTIEGARVLGIDHLVGSVEVGKRADLVVIDLDQPEMMPAHDLASNVLYAASVRSIRDVLVDGRVLVRGRALAAGPGTASARE